MGGSVDEVAFQSEVIMDVGVDPAHNAISLLYEILKRLSALWYPSGSGRNEPSLNLADGQRYDNQASLSIEARSYFFKLARRWGGTIDEALDGQCRRDIGANGLGDYSSR